MPTNPTIPCNRATDQDVLGLGVRLGAYLQACSLGLHIAWGLDAKSTADAALLTGAALFAVALCRYKVQSISDFGLEASISLFTFQMLIHLVYITHQGPPKLVAGKWRILFQGGKPRRVTLRRFIVHYIMLAASYSLRLFLVFSGELHGLHNAACGTAYTPFRGDLQSRRHTIIVAAICIFELLVYACVLLQSVRRMRIMARSGGGGTRPERPGRVQASDTDNVPRPLTEFLNTSKLSLGVAVCMLFQPCRFCSLKHYIFEFFAVLDRIFTRNVKCAMAVGMLLWTSMETELLLHWNLMTGVGEINGTGQLISFFIGVVTVAQAFFSMMQRKYVERNAQGIQLAIELAVDAGDGGHSHGSGSAYAADHPARPAYKPGDAASHDSGDEDDDVAYLHSIPSRDQSRIVHRMASRRLLSYNSTTSSYESESSGGLSRVLVAVDPPPPAHDMPRRGGQHAGG
jgi:hypothetical protein